VVAFAKLGSESTTMEVRTMGVIGRTFVDYCHLHGIDISWDDWNDTMSLATTINGKTIVLPITYYEALIYLKGVMKKAANA
jgi:hypothetical protein